MLDFLTGIFSSSYYTGLWLNTAVLISIAAFGNVITLKSGYYNLGGDAQIYMAGFVSSMCLVQFSSFPPVINIILTLLITLTVSGMVECLSSIFYIFKRVNVLLTTYLVSSALIPVLDYLTSVVFRTKEGNLLATEFIAENLRLKSILSPSPLNLSILFLPVLCVLVWVLLNKTLWGKRVIIFGKSEEFAIYSGLSLKQNLCSTLFIDGAIHGFAGFIAVVGTYFACYKGFANSMGWNALTCALLAGKNPLFVIPSGLFLSWLYTSASRFSLVNNFGFDMSGIIQGVVVFAVAGNIAFTKLWRKK
ncbi:MAG: ABC transporter permease [Treponema sp.]|uniref:ABC transporter permease subunit n=1 Tax=Treponema sp. TaxID=166 RepID=UPI00298E10C4|nr:hypothetical protein [Treponema sp.]MBR5933677.1 ABC transporter permease [Treponema sp.]